MFTIIVTDLDSNEQIPVSCMPQVANEPELLCDHINKVMGIAYWEAADVDGTVLSSSEI